MLAGDTEPWRHGPHGHWYDPLAALEDTKGPAFTDAAKTFDQQWTQVTRQRTAAIRRWRARIAHTKDAALPADPAYAHEVIQVPHPTRTSELRIQYAAAHTLTVWIDRVLAYTGLTALEVNASAGLLLTIKDVGAGAEQLELAVSHVGASRPLIRIRPVGPDAAFYGDRIVYLTVDNALRYNSVVSIHASPGKSKTHYTSKDPRCQLELIGSIGNDTVFVRESNALKKRIGYLTESSVHWMTPVTPSTLIPLSKTAWAENRHLVVNGRRTPLPHGEFLEDARQLSETEAVLVTVKNACCSLYRVQFHPPSITLLRQSKTPNQFKLSTYTPTALLTYPHKATEVLDVRTLRTLLTFPTPLSLPVVLHGVVASADGTKIPYTIVSHVAHPTKLIVEAYGAYGISSRRSYPIQWLAQLEQGYAYAVVFARGGRENGDAWWAAGSTAPKKHTTFEDVYAAIPAIQRRLTIPRHRTMVYGRSAGGWMAARVAQHQPPLCAAVFAEVPYVDVLRTTSNPRLPLTQMEYDEFGDPRRPEDYAALTQLSPLDTVPLAFPDAPVVLVRTGLHDMEVSPYEAVKWVTKLQAFGWKAWLAIDREGGHFAAKKQQVIQAAENAAILDAVIVSRPPPHGSPPRRGKRTAKRQSSKGSTFNSTRRRKH